MTEDTYPRGWDYNKRFTEHFKVTFFGNKISIKQSPSGSRVGATVWDTAVVMCAYFETRFNKQYFQNKRIIELGSGVGLTGIALASIGPPLVVLSDQAKMIPILKENVKLNLKRTNAKVEEYSWGSDPSFLKPPFDIIIGSDVVYEEDGIEPLVQAINDLADENTQIIIGWENRGMTAEPKWQEMIDVHFDYKQINSSTLGIEKFKDTNITICILKKKKVKPVQEEVATTEDITQLEETVTTTTTTTTTLEGTTEETKPTVDTTPTSTE